MHGVDGWYKMSTFPSVNNLFTVKDTRILYYKNSKGHMYIWQCYVIGDTVYVEYGRENGKMNKSSFQCFPKNVGRSNETTAHQQALKEAMALYKNKLDRKYSQTRAGAQVEQYLPMLAQTYQKREKYVDLSSGNWFSSPKLDGVRCLAFCGSDGSVQLLSRSGQEWYVPHIQKALESIMKPYEMLDGEIYIHGKTFQEITSLVKRYRTDSHALEFHYFERIDDIRNIQKFRSNGVTMYANTSVVKKVEYRIIKSKSDLDRAFNDYLNQGYEGAMLRGASTTYEFGKRSNNLLKYKVFEDNEFKIIDVVEGKGKFKGRGIFVCETNEGKTFQVTPKCEDEKKKAIWEWRENYPGNLLKVQHQGFTDDRIPRFPVGLGTRDPKDMST